LLITSLLIGREWFVWLSENQEIIEDILKNFETKRQNYYSEIIVSFDGINAGRLSTNLGLLDLIWEIALKCPALAEVLTDFTQDFDKGIRDLLMKVLKKRLSHRTSRGIRKHSK